MMNFLNCGILNANVAAPNKFDISVLKMCSSIIIEDGVPNIVHISSN
jgi:hypothetical protein